MARGMAGGGISQSEQIKESESGERWRFRAIHKNRSRLHLGCPPELTGRITGGQRVQITKCDGIEQLRRRRPPSSASVTSSRARSTAQRSEFRAAPCRGQLACICRTKKKAQPHRAAADR